MQYITCNIRWINYLWYNQQRFINWTILPLVSVHDQLHATSLMTLQNKLAIDTLLTENQGVCSHIGDECCTVILMHTGEGGNLTRILKQVKSLRDDHVNILIGTPGHKQYGTFSTRCLGKKSYS